jgi:hypothetical protein
MPHHYNGLDIPLALFRWQHVYTNPAGVHWAFLEYSVLEKDTHNHTDRRDRRHDGPHNTYDKRVVIGIHEERDCNLDPGVRDTQAEYKRGTDDVNNFYFVVLKEKTKWMNSTQHRHFGLASSAISFKNTLET